MSRSRRKSPFCGATVSPSDKLDKRLANRRVRRTVNAALQVDHGREVLPHHRELTDPWDITIEGIEPDGDRMIAFFDLTEAGEAFVDRHYVVRGGSDVHDASEAMGDA